MGTKVNNRVYEADVGGSPYYNMAMEGRARECRKDNAIFNMVGPQYAWEDHYSGPDRTNYRI